jgi:glycosyltransferase involved in cell wall biosynthesis
LPKVSVITAAYNHVQFVRQSVESVLNQTYRDFEHIVVDDGSSDGTAEVLKTFGDRIKYIRQENRGVPAAINAGIRESSGEYIAILDSDDAWLPQKLERQMPVFEEFPTTSVVYSQAYTIGADGEMKDGDNLQGGPLNPETAFDDLLRHDPIPVLTAVIKKSCIDEVGGFSETLRAISDWDLWIRISTRWPIVFIPDPLALYRIHGRNSFIELNESGQVNRERLLMLRDTIHALSDSAFDNQSKRQTLYATYAYIVMQQAYGLFSRSQYSKAVAYLALAFKLRPALLKDLPAALKLDPALFTNGKPRRMVANLVFGYREN